MAKRKRNLTPNQKAYKKELNRIKRALRYRQKKGLEIEPDFLEEIDSLSKAKRVTKKRLETLQSYTPKAINTKIIDRGKEEQKPIQTPEAPTEEKQEEQQDYNETLPSMYDTVYYNYRNLIENGINEPAKRMVLNFLDYHVSTDMSVREMGMLIYNYDKVGDLIQPILYESEFAPPEINSTSAYAYLASMYEFMVTVDGVIRDDFDLFNYI